MSYEKINFKNREVEKPLTFKKHVNDDGTITLEPKPGTIVEPGTPLLADHFNHMDDGIYKAHKEIDNLKLSGIERNKELVANLNSKKVSATTNDSLKTNIAKVKDIKLGSGNAVTSDVLEGKTFSSSQGTDLLGTMRNNGTLSKTITTQGGTQKISPGYYEGGEVKSQFNNLTPENIKIGVNIGGIKGTLQEQTLHYIQGGPTRHARRYSSESRYVNPVNFEMFLGGEIKYSIEAHVDFDYDYYSTLILYKNGVRIDSVTSYRQTVRKEGTISVKSGDIVRAEYECGLKTEGAGAYISLSYNLSDDPYGKSYED